MSSPNPLVLIPYYEPPPLRGARLLSLRAAVMHLWDYDWAFMGPYGVAPTVTGKDTIHIDTPRDLWNAGPDGRRGYNPLMVSRGLYDQIESLGYTHVLVYHPDAVVFSDQLSAWCAAPLDYVGAPHRAEDAGDFTRYALDPMGAFIVKGCGGGLVLRNVRACLRVLHGMPPWLNIDSYYRHIGINEDLFWSFQAPEADPTFRVATLDDSLRFAWQGDPALCYVLNRWKLPMGAHSWERNSPEFWLGLGGISSLVGLEDSPRAPEQAPPPAATESSA